MLLVGELAGLVGVLLWALEDISDYIAPEDAVGGFIPVAQLSGRINSKRCLSPTYIYCRATAFDC